MKMRVAIICVVLYLKLTVAQNQLQVYRGNLVHSRDLNQIEILEDYLLGFDPNNRGEVSATACRRICAVQYRDSDLVCPLKIKLCDSCARRCNMRLFSHTCMFGNCSI